MNTVVGEFMKNAADLVRVSKGEYNGRTFIDARVYYQADDGSWKPTKKGIAVAPDKLPELISLLEKARNGGKK